MLPQGMKNSPTIHQWFVARVLAPVHQDFPIVLLYHYMDDILIAAATTEETRAALTAVVHAVQQARLKIASEKVQRFPPWQYLG